MRIDLLHILGKEYVIDNFISYIKRKSEETTLRVYITDALKIIAENTSVLPKEGQIMARRFADLIAEPNNKDSDVDDDEKARDIINNIKSKLGSMSGSGKEDE